MSQQPDTPSDARRLLVQIASYNTNLQGNAGFPQDLVDWLSPTFQTSNFLANKKRAPDIVAVGFQELQPLHLGLAGQSKSVLESRDALILSQIEAHAPNKERYSLVAKVVNVGVALLVYARDAGLARHVTDVQTQYIGCGPLFMGNKGAVGVRFCVDGEVFTFVCAHLSAHTYQLEKRIRDYHHIVRNLVFPPSSVSAGPSTIYATSHLFFFGDLNFRVSVPPSHPFAQVQWTPRVAEYLAAEGTLEKLKEYDQLYIERRTGTVFAGLREGEFWRFQCSYKYELGEVNKFSDKRTPAWTDRILYATFADSPFAFDECHITNLLYTSIPSYTMSDHKPIVSLLLLPASSSSAALTPFLRLPPTYTPTPSSHAATKRRIGRYCDRIIGYIWWLQIMLGAGNLIVIIFNFCLSFSIWRWWKGGWQRIPGSATV